MCKKNLIHTLTLHIDTHKKNSACIARPLTGGIPDR